MDFEAWVQWVWSRLPVGWWPTVGTLIGAVVGMISTGAAQNSADLSYMEAQTRIASATGFWLDAISVEYFGLGNKPRRSGELDEPFAQRLLQGLLPPLCAPNAVVSAVTNLGAQATLFEPSIDGCAIGVNMAFGIGPGLGNYGDCNECFLDATLPQGDGFQLPGIGMGAFGLSFGLGDQTLFDSSVAEEEVLTAVRLTKPAGVFVYTRFAPNAPAQ